MRQISTFVCSCCLLLFTGCDLEEVNENPNVPSEVPLSTLLPPAQKGLADAVGGRIFRYSGIFGQHLKGVDNQELLVENYQPDEQFVGTVWSDIYVGSMINLQEILDLGEGTSPHYTGVARVLMAQSLGTLTDVWGDVPYSEALLGADFPNPVYDGQEAVYASIQALLDQAIVDLNLPESTFSPGADDIMYGGNLGSWRSAANLLKARYYMHTTKRDGQAAQLALNALSDALSEIGQDFQYPYLGMGEDINPIASFYEITPYAEIDEQFIALLDLLEDPRRTYMFKNIPFSGGRKRPGDFYASGDSPVKLGGYVEQLFLLAEARYRTTDQLGAAMALEEAVALSVAQVSEGAADQAAIDTYILTNCQLTGVFEDDLKTILTQKYIALFTTLEPWTDWRRTGYPELLPNSVGSTAANPNGEIPRRLIYPQSERLRNTNFPAPAPDMQTRFWWDFQ